MDSGSDPGDRSWGHEKREDSGFIWMGEAAGLTGGSCERQGAVKGSDCRFLACAAGRREIPEAGMGEARGEKTLLWTHV